MITQEFLSQCSEGQINKGVAWLQSGVDVNFWADCETGALYKYFKSSSDVERFESCTNPSDAWPIIEWIFNQGVTFAMNDGGIMTGNLGSKYGGIKLDIAAKPLRAAMEVYILMSVNK